MAEDRNGSGQFTPEHTDAEILAAVRAHDPAATSEVAEEVGMTRQGADRRLRRLRDNGRVNSKKIGASLVWFTPAPTSENTDPDETPPVPTENGPAGAEVSPTPAPPEPESGDESDTTSDSRDSDALEGAVREFLANRPPKTSHGTDAVLGVFRLLRERGTMKTGALKAELYPTYSEHYGSERAMWESLSRYLDDVPGVAKGGYGEWTYAGDDAVRESVEGDVCDPTTEF